MLRPQALITDIEGTEAVTIVAEIAGMVPGVPVLDTLRRWMDEDAKVTPLKTLQGQIWHEGYASGEILGALYPDVAPALRRWSHAGLRQHVYSSGSVAAQKLLFGHSVAGDLTGLFAGFFDTGVGHKREPESYDRLCIALNVPPAEVVFLSDTEAELDAAAAAGLRTCQLVRPEDGTITSARHQTARDFAEVGRICAL